MQLFDLHCDSIVKYKEENSDFLCGSTQFSLREIKEMKRICQAMAVFIPDDIRGEAAFHYFQTHAEYMRLLTDRQSDIVEQVMDASDIRRITEAGKCAAILAVESGAALAGKLEHIDVLADYGVKMMTLVWNGRNELGSGHDTEEGLTEFGRQAVKRMEEKKMIVDVSHLNDPGFDQVCAIAKKPFIATHSNLRSVAGHRRNLTDDQFREIVKRGGLAGLNLHEPFVSDDKNGDAAHVYRHIEKMLELGGEKVIACGSDFDGADIDEGLDTPRKFAALADYLLQKGIKETVVDGIFFDNALEFFEKNM